MLVCLTFVVDISGGQFLFLNVLFAFVWLTFLVSVIGGPRLSHFGSSVIALWLYH